MNRPAFMLPLYPKRLARRHDCGKHGQLTVREISSLTGRNQTTIYNRIARGVQGESLASNPPRRSMAARYREQAFVSPGVHGGMYIACRIARTLKSERDIPSVAKLMHDFEMSRATAYRWRAAWLAAMGLDHA